jgi:DNA polymerase III alpha subunit (gram-positive type)
MEIMKLNCASCGSPIQIQSDTEFLTCPFCSTQLAVDRGQNFLTLKIVEKVSQAINQTGASTQSAIRDGTQTTQSELKRLQITQDISLLHLQLSSIQSEIRELQREKKSKTQIFQLNELRSQESNLKQRIAFLHNALTSTQSAAQEEDRQMQARIKREQQERRESQAQIEKERRLIEEQKLAQLQAEKEKQIRLEQEKSLAVRQQEQRQAQIEKEKIRLQKEELKNLRKLNRKPVSGWLFIGIGGPIFIVGVTLFMLFSVMQITGEGGVTENLQGFIGAQIICPLPIALIGFIFTLIGILRLIKRRKQKI